MPLATHPVVEDVFARESDRRELDLEKSLIVGFSLSDREFGAVGLQLEHGEVSGHWHFRRGREGHLRPVGHPT